MEWLANQTLIGHTAKRGEAWHRRFYENLPADWEDNHYADGVPIADVHRRLFHWNPVEVKEQWTYTTKDGEGEDVSRLITGADKVIIRSDTGAKLGTFKDGYQPHPYGEWLLDNVGTILDDELSIGSAGLLRGGAVAWVSVEVPDSITTPEGVEFRPNLIACTSFDGSLSTTYKRLVTNIVCDNTLAAGLNEDGQQVKVKHTRNSALRIADAREALNIVYSIADDFEAEVKRLYAQDVSSRVFGEFLDAYVPRPTEAGRGQTVADNKRDALSGLYASDPRVAPWQGTAWGVVQMVNTYNQWIRGVRGETSREERTMLNALKGKTAEDDTEALELLLSLV